MGSGETSYGAGGQAARSLPDFVAAAGDLSADERRRVIDQALVLIEQLYVHLPLKRAMHAVDPVQRLRLLRYRVGALTERQFHDQMISIFIGVRDLHTNYILPRPYRGRDAVLPFRIERFFADGEARYVVTRVATGFTDALFAPGVEVTHWNGVPIDRAVELNAERNAGSNEPARRARGLESMTQRPLSMLAPPDEDWVVVGFTVGGEAREISFPWEVRDRLSAPNAMDTAEADERIAASLGVDALVEAMRRAQKALFAPEKIELELQMAEAGAAAPADELGAVSTMPDVLEFRSVSTPHGEFGYLRIRTFSVGRTDADVDAFIAEVQRILELLPRHGLIIDVRGNGGGIITAGERLLQLFTPRRIQPERLHFVNTPLTLRLASEVPWLADWQPSIAQSVELGTAFSDGLPLDDQHEEICNAIGQRYHGPVALVIDALCYSTTDIFAAGFQDHGIGPVVGTDGNTGAGGANVWDHVLLSRLLPGQGSAIQPLPRDTAMRVAIRRTTRVGERSGDPLEDLGVLPDQRHDMTLEDVMGSNEDLIAAVAELLAARPSYRLDAEPGEPDGGVLPLTVTTANLTRIDLHVDDRPRETLDVADGEHAVQLPVDGPSPHLIELRGFADGELVASRRLEA
jgi:hypothetical protein